MRNLLINILFFSILFTSCTPTNPIDEVGATVQITTPALTLPIVFPEQDSIQIDAVLASSKGLYKMFVYRVDNGVETQILESRISGSSYTFSQKLELWDTTTSFRVENMDASSKKVSASYVITITPATWVAQLGKVFPQAEGCGQYTTGGRLGKVIYVTTTADNTAQGSLRWALAQSGKRTIVFKIGGTISLMSPIIIRNGDVTIAGQTALGGGITIKDYTVEVAASNVIIQFVRFRMGDVTKTADDALWGRRNKNILIDHCTMSWSTDECASFYDNENFTMQWCLISESLRNSVHDKGSHGYGGIWGGQKASFHHNLLAHHDSRNPRFCGSRYTNRPDLEKVDFRNNVIYNWRSNSVYAGEGGSYNMVNNYYKPGPATIARGGSQLYRILQPYPDSGELQIQPAGVWGVFYVNGNYIDGNASVTADNWDGGIQPSVGSKPLSELKSDTEFSFATGTVTTQTAQDAYLSVLLYAGASKVRDAVDTRIINEVQNGTYTYSGSNGSVNGIIDSQADVGGWPIFLGGVVPIDTDGDGMPDVWEDVNGLNKYDASDRHYNTVNAARTNLETYLNSLVEDLYP
jgi:hypothetical protein